jgi:hypothetical protein
MATPRDAPNACGVRAAYCWQGRMPEFVMDDCEIDHYFTLRATDDTAAALSIDGLAASAGGGAQVDEAGGGEVSSLRYVSLPDLAVEIETDPSGFTPTLLGEAFHRSRPTPVKIPLKSLTAKCPCNSRVVSVRSELLGPVSIAHTARGSARRSTPVV